LISVFGRDSRRFSGPKKKRKGWDSSLSVGVGLTGCDGCPCGGKIRIRNGPYPASKHSLKSRNLALDSKPIIIWRNYTTMANFPDAKHPFDAILEGYWEVPIKAPSFASVVDTCYVVFDTGTKS
jgi:hypothetical protein